MADSVKKVSNSEEVKERLYDMNNCIRKSEKHKNIDDGSKKSPFSPNKHHRDEPTQPYDKHNDSNLANPVSDLFNNYSDSNPKPIKSNHNNHNFKAGPNFNVQNMFSSNMDTLDKICNDRKDKFRQKLISNEDIKVKRDHNGSLSKWLKHSNNQYPTPEKFCFKAPAWNQPNIFDLTLSKQQCLTLSQNNQYHQNNNNQDTSRIQAWSHEQSRDVYERNLWSRDDDGLQGFKSMEL